MKNRLLLLALSAILLLSLFSCAKPSYRNDASPAELSAAAVAAIGTPDEYSVAAEGYLDDYFTAPSYVTAYSISFATDGNNLDELGIYQVTEGNAEAMKAVLEKYLSDSLDRNREWYDSYIPKETPKLRDAEVKVFGSYVVYAICDKNDRAAVFSSIEALLQ